MFDTKRILQMNLQGVHILFVVALLTSGCQAQPSVTVQPTNNFADAAPNADTPKPASKIKFSSVYTKLNSKTCKPTYKPESETDEPPEICTGYKGYKIYVQTHGISRFYVGREISATDKEAWINLELPSFLFSGEPVIEWRLANGEPFACIVRAVYDKQIFDADEKGMVNKLVVQNLRGFASISISIDAEKNKRANQDARHATDTGYRKL